MDLSLVSAAYVTHTHTHTHTHIHTPPLLDVDLSLVSAAYVTHTHTSVCETDGLKVLGAACGCIKGGLAISWITVMCVCACVCATL